MKTYFKPNRRQFLAASSSSLALPMLGCATSSRFSKSSAVSPRWVSSSKDAVWHELSEHLQISDGGQSDVRVAKDQPAQIIEGFGACFNELGWDALSLLPTNTREAVLADFFKPGNDTARGMGFTHCRMPIAANDFARDWYSYNETDQDFSMDQFSIARDETALIPYIQAARHYQPNLSLWASPWSPPVWMKTNKHYAQNVSDKNDLQPEQVMLEGQDGFIQDERYFKAYALYFKKFIEAYRAQDIPIEMVMPQNEFNSNQSFPSCVWTPEALARFIPHLHSAVGPLGVSIFFGTLERPNTKLFDRAYDNPEVRDVIKGIGFQWHGRPAVPFLAREHPELKLYQTEQECGDGKNDWRFARYTWDLMRDYMRAGVHVYQYWNMALVKNKPSTWGWNQNSLIVVDPNTKTYRFTPDYYMLKHVCHFVEPGAQRVNAKSWTGYDNALAFVNTDGREVLVIQNDQPDVLPVRIGIAGKIATAALPPNSLNTISL